MNTQLQPSKRLITCNEAASRLSVSDATVRNWFKAGKLAGIRHADTGMIRIHADAVDRMIDSQEYMVNGGTTSGLPISEGGAK